MSLVKSPAFRVFEFEAKLDDTFLDECAKGAIAPLETLNETPLTGWSSPRYLVDGEINADTCRAGKYVHLFVSTAQRRVPASLLAVYCRKTELEMMKEKGVSSLSRATVREIRESVRKQMLKRMPPSISGLEVAIDTDRSIVYTDAKTDKQVDAVSLAFHQAARSALVPLDPAGAALRRFGVQADSLAPAVRPNSPAKAARRSPSPWTVPSRSSSKRRAPTTSRCGRARRSRARSSSPRSSPARRWRRSASASRSATTRGRASFPAPRSRSPA